MRMSSEGDQKLIRSAVSDAAASLLAFIPSLGTREVFAFGSGVALPTRMRFAELAAHHRPNSEASGNTRSEAGTNMNRDLLASVIERWRNASMSHRMSDDEIDYGSPLEAPALQPAQAPVEAQAPVRAPTKAPVYDPTQAPVHAPAQAPVYAPAAAMPAPAQPVGYNSAPPPRPEGLRSSILKKPLNAGPGAPPKPILPSRFR